MNKKSQIKSLVVSLFIMFFCQALFGFSSAFAKTFYVYSTDDNEDSNPGDGLCESTNSQEECTLRAAIEEANATPGMDTIEFNLCSYGYCDFVGDDIYTNEVEMEYWIIQPASRLPYITDPVRINGWSQIYTTEQQDDFFGYRQRVMLFSRDNSVDLGLVIEEGGNGSVIEGLSIVGFTDTAIDVANVSEVVISKNRIGKPPRREGDFGDWPNGGMRIGINLAGEQNRAIKNYLYDMQDVGIQLINSYNIALENDLFINDVGIRVNGATHIIKGNRIRSSRENGVSLYGRYHTVEGNDISGSTHGVWVSARDLILEDNDIFNNNTALWINFGYISIHHNNCYDHSSYLDINNVTGVDVNAANNWWGTSAGPITQVGTPARVSANVLVVPWLSTKPARC